MKRLFVKILCAFVSALLAGWLGLFGLIFVNASSINAPQKSDAIVVLGAAQWNGEPSPMFRARLDHAYELYDAGYAPVILLTGGVGAADEESEAIVGSRYLRGREVPPDALAVDPHGNTTFESLQSVVHVMRERGINSSILVSHDFHAFRLKKMARDLGITAVFSPVQTENFFSNMRYTARETIVYAMYRLFGI